MNLRDAYLAPLSQKPNFTFGKLADCFCSLGTKAEDMGAKLLAKGGHEQGGIQISKRQHNLTYKLGHHVDMSTAAPSVPFVPPVPTRPTEPHFYKYGSLNHSHEDDHRKRLDWLQNIILTHHVYVPSLTELNDPAEGRPRLTPLSEEQLHAFLLDPQPRIGRLLDDMILRVNIPLHTPQKLLRSMSDILFNELKDTKIYCMTKRSNHMGMWAKYADEHCGYCLEFANEGVFGQAKQVIYTDAELNITKREQIGGWFFFCKGSDWSSEEEVRIHLSRHTPHLLNFDPRLLTSIILGWKMPEPDRTLIQRWAKQRNPELTVRTANWDAYEGKLRIL